ncbi:hypothetical protein AB6735_27195 [Mucilaginibacter sp. RCC_168]|uniref:hypothetical protein n=1 Tax=Mucilaginibacter sp. RCC_168 TaxID=3239221 RepID=UPI003525052C
MRKGTDRLLWGLAFLILISVSVSCKKKISNNADLMEYISNPENGLVKTVEINKIKAELRYKPWQLMSVNQNKIQKQATENAEIAMRNKYFFVLSLSANDKELLRQLPFNQYSEMVQVLAFRMMNYISLMPDDKKPIVPEGCLFQQTYGMAHANQLLIIFDKTKLETAKQLKIKIKEFGLRIGDLNFQINNKDIQDLPDPIIN